MMASFCRLLLAKSSPLGRYVFFRHLSSAIPEPLVLTQQQDGIHIVTLNNPQKRNALSLPMLNCLKEELTACQQYDDLRVIIIRATGPVFCSGHDLKELVGVSNEKHVEIFKTCSKVMMMIQDLNVPVIAQVAGLATAAGCQLVASCDLAIASDQAKFAVPGVSIGLFCSTPGVALGRSIPKKVAMEMLFTGNPISASVALKHGLLSKIVSPDVLEEETMNLAKRICESSRSVIALGKAAFYHQMELDRNAAYEYTEKIMISNLNKEDGQEGICAFLQKRRPHWTHH